LGGSDFESSRTVTVDQVLELISAG
jgi:hypothetical protein